jgi:hypothetical protein
MRFRSLVCTKKRDLWPQCEAASAITTSNGNLLARTRFCETCVSLIRPLIASTAIFKYFSTAAFFKYVHKIARHVKKGSF